MLKGARHPEYLSWPGADCDGEIPPVRDRCADSADDVARRSERQSEIFRGALDKSNRARAFVQIDVGRQDTRLHIRRRLCTAAR